MWYLRCDILYMICDMWHDVPYIFIDMYDIWYIFHGLCVLQTYTYIHIHFFSHCTSEPNCFDRFPGRLYRYFFLGWPLFRWVCEPLNLILLHLPESIEICEHCIHFVSRFLFWEVHANWRWRWAFMHGVCLRNGEVMHHWCTWHARRAGKIL